MPFQRMKSFWTIGLMSAVAFLVLFLIRMDVLQQFLHTPKSLAGSAAPSPPVRESWMSIFQNQRRIGFSHTRFFPTSAGYELEEKVMMRINTMGMIQDIRLRTRADLYPDLSLHRFEFNIRSGSFRFSAQGSASGDVLSIHTETAGHQRVVDLPLRKKVYLTATLLDRLQGERLKPGDRFTFEVFDPAALAQTTVTAEVIGREIIQLGSASIPATRISMGLRGMTQTAWISDSGELLRERGLLGMRLEKTTREEALSDLGLPAAQDLAEAAAVIPDRRIFDPQRMDVLRVRIGGVSTDVLPINGGRQRFSDGILTVQREDLSDLPAIPATANLTILEQVYLKPEPLIQSDHERIRSLVRSILGNSPSPSPLAQSRLLMDWIGRHIEKRPVLSMPDALSTLENRMGDCNEHAMLFAALARAAGIPARVEAGLVYLQGKFYYHAWNLLFLGRWVTADALFGQLPADATHLRLATGSMQQQVDLVGVIGNITIEILD
jgi:Transglutaminase-like superfamily